MLAFLSPSTGGLVSIYYRCIQKNGKVKDDGRKEKMLPWNMDLKKLTDYRARIAQAKPDVNRKESYILGNSR